MYASFPQVVFGFHGCDRKVGEAIIAGKMTLAASKNTHDWLGSGIYFWENAPARALAWAKECRNNLHLTSGKVTDPFVIGAIIDIGHCLNLTDPQYVDVISDAYELVEKSYCLANLELPQNIDKRKELDCLVINAAITQNRRNKYEAFDTVRGAYIEGEPIYRGATLYAQTHIQLCVRNPNCIKGYFNPLEAVDEFPIP
jgi:hypothetical protein